MKIVSNKEAAEFILELQEYIRGGVTLWLNEESCSPIKAAQECLLREEACYMRDYIRDESDRITQIRFDRIAPSSEKISEGGNFSEES